jgi:hypothetical protein
MRSDLLRIITRWELSSQGEGGRAVLGMKNCQIRVAVLVRRMM